jgi:hypothetical protein
MIKRVFAATAGTAALVLVPSMAYAAVVADWEMDEPTGATVMVDSAGGNNGHVGSRVITGVPGLKGGLAYQFDGSSTSNVQVPDSPTLDPGSADITLTATVLIKAGPIKDDSYEVVRKGLVTTKGGDWKMEIKRSGSSVGKLHCVFNGVLSNGKKAPASVEQSSNVADGKAHTLQCVKTNGRVAAVVDGKSRIKSLVTGSISNDQGVIVGSKSPGDDVMIGTIDQVSVDIG